MDDQDEPAAKPQRTLFTSRREYVEGFDKVVSLARRELRIFDPDLMDLGLDSRERIESIEAFLRGGRLHKLFIALHDPDQLVRRLPRVMNMLTQFSANILICKTGSEAARAEDCFVLADSSHVVRRAVAKQPRGVLLLDDNAEGRLMLDRFREIWDRSTPSVSATTSGL